MCRADSVSMNSNSDDTAFTKKKKTASKKLQAAKFKKAPGAPR